MCALMQIQSKHKHRHMQRFQIFEDKIMTDNFAVLQSFMRNHTVSLNFDDEWVAIKYKPAICDAIDLLAESENSVAMKEYAYMVEGLCLPSTFVKYGIEGGTCVSVHQLEFLCKKANSYEVIGKTREYTAKEQEHIQTSRTNEWDWRSVVCFLAEQHRVSFRSNEVPSWWDYMNLIVETEPQFEMTEDIIYVAGLSWVNEDAPLTVEDLYNPGYCGRLKIEVIKIRLLELLKRSIDERVPAQRD